MKVPEPLVEPTMKVPEPKKTARAKPLKPYGEYSDLGNNHSGTFSVKKGSPGGLVIKVNSRAEGDTRMIRSNDTSIVSMLKRHRSQALITPPTDHEMEQGFTAPSGKMQNALLKLAMPTVHM